MARIEVTHADIMKGIPRSAYCCPIANALKRMTNKRAIVGRAGFAITEGKTVLAKGLLPEEATQFVDKFDQGRLVHPFEFDINV